MDLRKLVKSLHLGIWTPDGHPEECLKVIEII